MTMARRPTFWSYAPPWATRQLHGAGRTRTAPGVGSRDPVPASTGTKNLHLGRVLCTCQGDSRTDLPLVSTPLFFGAESETLPGALGPRAVIGRGSPTASLGNEPLSFVSAVALFASA